MAQDNKVVSLREAQGQRSSVAPALVRLRDASARSLARILSEFFDRADDVLFGMADRAGSNQDQVAYFDAMRELRLRRKVMGTAVLHWVARAFNELGRFDPMPNSRGLEEVDQDSLTLMEDSELERKVAIEGLVNKLATRYAEQVRLLNVRISHASGLTNLQDRQMPISPEVICSALDEAISELSIDIRARLVVLKLFDRLLVDRLDEFYRDANRLLIAEGILPEMRRAPVAGSNRGQASGRSDGQHLSPEAGVDGPLLSNSGLTRPVPPSRRPSPDLLIDDYSGGQYSFSELTALLHQGDDQASYSNSGSVPLIDTAALMQELGRLQGSATAGEHGEVVPLSALLGRALPAGRNRQLPVNQVDGDVINLVAMLFEFILDDRQLPPVMKMLIGRLQIPVLKVALLDRSFFNRGGHPARKLLNELAMAGIGWTPKAEGQRDPLREKVEQLVNRLLNEFTDNVSLFGELLADFTHFMDLDRRRRELVEQRLRDAEEGRARQELARDRVNAMLADLMTGRDLPEKAVALIEEPWRKHLEWVYLRQGAESERWQSASNLTDQLIWSLDPHPVTDATRSELLRLIPEITDALRLGLQEISWDPFATDAAIRDLELAHVDVLQRLLAPKHQDAEPPVVSRSGDLPLAEAAGDEVDSLAVIEEFDALMDSLPDRAAIDETGGQAIPAADDSDSADDRQQVDTDTSAQAGTSVPETQAPSISERQPGVVAAESAVVSSEEPAPDSSTPVDPAWVQRAASMRVGCWVEMQRDSDQGRLRCKLAAIIRATGKYIFVNRNGAKVAEYRQEELAEALAQGQLMMLDDGLIFDRALESIIDNLRHNRRD